MPDTSKHEDIEPGPPDQPFAFIQWKGTTVCMDLNCTCGEASHLDADFAYLVRCGCCGKVWRMPSYVTLTRPTSVLLPAPRETHCEA